MSNLSPQSDNSQHRPLKALDPVTAPFSPAVIPPLLKALQKRAEWFHEHPTRSPLLMRLEAESQQRNNG